VRDQQDDPQRNGSKPICAASSESMVVGVIARLAVGGSVLNRDDEIITKQSLHGAGIASLLDIVPFRFQGDYFRCHVACCLYPSLVPSQQ
jgi:hypothetical protein